MNTRRRFISLLGGAATMWPVVARGEQAGSLRRIAVLLGNTANDPQALVGIEKLTTALRGLGWIDGRNMRIEYRWSEGNVARMNELAKELVGLKPDVILGSTTQVIAALQRETKTIPIVFIVVSDPVGSGFVASIPRPGGNITGFINIEGSLAGKWIELLREVVPQVTRVGLMFNQQTAPYAAYYLGPFENAARSYGVEPIDVTVRDANDIDRVIAILGSKPGSGLVIMADIFTAVRPNLMRIISSADRHRVPVVYPFRFMVQAGGLISYGVDTTDLFRRSATYIDRILNGTKPADLPVQLPTKFELAVNLKTAKDLAVEIPATILGRADEVIE